MTKLPMLGVLGFSAVLIMGMSGRTWQNGSGPLVPLNVKTGQWQTHSRVALSGAMGLPPEMAEKLTPEERARYEAAMGAMNGVHELTTKGCLTQQDLTTDPYAELNRNGEMQCHGEVAKSTSSDVELEEHCIGAGKNQGAEMKMHLHIHANDPEHATGEGEGSTAAGGKTMQTKITLNMTWLGPHCPTH